VIYVLVEKKSIPKKKGKGIRRSTPYSLWVHTDRIGLRHKNNREAGEGGYEGRKGA